MTEKLSRIEATYSYGELLLQSITHSFSHTWSILPLLFLLYFFMLFYEKYRTPAKVQDFFTKMNSPFSAALLGMIPQCSVPVLASGLYFRKKIRIGTLLAVFIASSDEGMWILLGEKQHWQDALALLLIKVPLGMVVGYIANFLAPIELPTEVEAGEESTFQSFCGCCSGEGNIRQRATKHAIKMYAWVYGIYLFFDFLMAVLGKEQLLTLLLTDSIWQPFIVAGVGLLPSCAISMLIASFYLSGVLSFGATLAGLTAATGFGLLVLIRDSKNPIYLAKIICPLYLVASLAGVICQEIM